jgi:hypothetical protein
MSASLSARTPADLLVQGVEGRGCSVCVRRRKLAQGLEEEEEEEEVDEEKEEEEDGVALDPKP